MQCASSKKAYLLLASCALIALLLPSCKKNSNKAMELTSSSFKHQAAIPVLLTCDGQNQSPDLAWDNEPEKTQSLALIMDDPDAPSGSFAHWVAWNIDAKSHKLKANIGAEVPQTVLTQGLNSAGKPGYKGPCPPSGLHRYFFRLYALDTKLSLPTTATREHLLIAMKGHILGTAELMGKYEKESSR